MATEGTGANAARELGQGWKVSPSIHIQPKQTAQTSLLQGLEITKEQSQSLAEEYWATVDADDFAHPGLVTRMVPGITLGTHSRTPAAEP